MAMQIDSVSSFVGLLDQFKDDLGLKRSTWNPWYRGHSDVDWTLLPSMYRPPERAELERELLRDFKIWMSTEHSFSPNNEIEWIFVAQHHGLPTRMLDWTENPLVSLFFAAENSHNNKDGKIFVIHPAEFNEMVGFSTHNNIPNSQGLVSVPTTDQEFFSHYIVNLIDSNVSREPAAKLPTAFRPKSRFKRSMSQNGVFTIHGNDKTPLDKYQPSPFGIKMIEIIVPYGEKQKIKRQIYDVGINHGYLFGDPDSVAKSVRYRYSRKYLRN
jgi:hypothetical protein